MFFFLPWIGCSHEPIPLPPPPKPIQLTTTATNYIESRTHILKGWYHAHRKEWSQSRQSFYLAAQAEPMNPWVYLECGNAEFQYGHLLEARTAWRKAKETTLDSQVDLRAHINQKLEQAEME